MVKLYNTLTRTKEDLTTREPGKVHMYVCGPTTYNYIHLGNARPIVVFDVIRRYLEYRGYQVVYVQNFTDVDDKIINRAKEEGETPAQLALKYIDEYFKDADALGVRRANYHPRVTEHMDEIIEMVSTIIDNGHAYELDGSVYFDVRSFPSYGKLSRRDLDDLRSGARVEVDTSKKDPLDFALWKAAKPTEPAWESPWGLGRPGWHIECSAMSLKYLFNGFDIHGGGFDLIFPHHENEIAQAEAYSNQQPFVKHWLHNGFITVNQEKMSKSLGNFFLVREILDKFCSDVVRFYLLSTHYRSPLDFDDEKLEMSARGLERLKTARDGVRELLADGKDVDPREIEALSGNELAMYKLVEQARGKFTEAMDDDFNTALAIAVLFEISKDINKYRDGLIKEGGSLTAQQSSVLSACDKLYNDFGVDVLGIFDANEKAVGDEGMVQDLIELLIEVRQQARAKKDWAAADLIRDQLADKGINLEDTPQGCRWKWA
ncbi:cysteine--tRNA ligase [Metallumcola ferriviriculae]|uniref:Cysteine--tRNA ligase n=2 Tax=Metallumcola ferriviriculae TaxID=3039180 RepID=A0AAU0UJ46_9FIRM|nr:cysteine--tRNA ligase [Desulfitibacteraceae bacterium MK1]